MKNRCTGLVRHQCLLNGGNFPGDAPYSCDKLGIILQMTHSIPGYGIFSWKAIGQFRRALAEAGGSAGFAIFQGPDLGWALSPVAIDPELGRASCRERVGRPV